MHILVTASVKNEKKKNVKLAMVLGIIISDKNEALISHLASAR